VSLANQVAGFFKKETVELKCDNDRCTKFVSKENTDHSKVTWLQGTPRNVLFVGLGRSLHKESRSSRSTCRVTELAKEIRIPFFGGRVAVYTVGATADHHGQTSQSGHYTVEVGDAPHHVAQMRASLGEPLQPGDSSYFAGWKIDGATTTRLPQRSGASNLICFVALQLACIVEPSSA
jgi:hypothetical protein